MHTESFGINRFQGIRVHHLTDKAAAWTVSSRLAQRRPQPPDPKVPRPLENRIGLPRRLKRSQLRTERLRYARYYGNAFNAAAPSNNLVKQFVDRLLVLGSRLEDAEVLEVGK
jgi:hypothetical protein